MDVGIGVSGMTYKPSRSFTSPRPESLFQEDIEDLVKPIHGSNTPRPKDTMPSIKMEPMTECRGDWGAPISWEGVHRAFEPKISRGKSKY